MYSVGWRDYETATVLSFFFLNSCFKWFKYFSCHDCEWLHVCCCSSLCIVGICRSTPLWALEGASITSEIRLFPAVQKRSLFWMLMSVQRSLSKRCSAFRKNTGNQTALLSLGQRWDFIFGSNYCVWTCVVKVQFLGSFTFCCCGLCFEVLACWEWLSLKLLLHFCFVSGKQKTIHELWLHCWKWGNKWGK